MLGFARTAGAKFKKKRRRKIKAWPRDWNEPRRWRPSSRGLGYAGAYIGGTHHADHIRWIIQRAEELAPRWEELAEEISYGEKGGFYFFESPHARAEAARIDAEAVRHAANPPTRRGHVAQAF